MRVSILNLELFALCCTLVCVVVVCVGACMPGRAQQFSMHCSIYESQDASVAAVVLQLFL